MRLGRSEVGLTWVDMKRRNEMRAQSHIFAYTPTIPYRRTFQVRVVLGCNGCDMQKVVVNTNTAVRTESIGGVRRGERMKARMRVWKTGWMGGVDSMNEGIGGRRLSGDGLGREVDSRGKETRRCASEDIVD